MDGFFNFLASRNGRITRLVIGVIVLIIGLAIGFQTKHLVGWIITTYAIFLLLETALDLIVLAPFFGKPMSGPGIRGEIAVDDNLSEFKRVQPQLDEKSVALLNLMRFWLFGTFCIVSAAVYSYATVMVANNNLSGLFEAFKSVAPVLGAVAVLCVFTYTGYWWYIVRIKPARAAKK
jgi:hypothetical protein